MDFDARTRMFSRPPVKIGVVADSYDNREGLRQLLDRFLVGGARWLFHCGGLGSASLLALTLGSAAVLSGLFVSGFAGRPAYRRLRGIGGTGYGCIVVFFTGSETA